MKAVKKFPDSEKAYFNLAIVYDRIKDFDNSIKAFQEVLKLNPQNADAYNYIGYTYAEQGRNLDEAYNLILKALEIEKDNGYFIDSLGWVYYKKGMYEKALKELLRAMEKLKNDEKEDPVIYEHIGDVYIKLGKLDEAKKYFNKALQFDSERKNLILEKLQKIETGEK